MAINNINGFSNGVTSKTTNSKAAKQESSASSTSSSSVGAQDTVKLTAQAQSLSKLEQKITDAPDTDKNKIASIKAAIENGEYKINPDRLAGKLLSQESALFGE